jgi:hypothetical protein
MLCNLTSVVRRTINRILYNFEYAVALFVVNISKLTCLCWPRRGPSKITLYAVFKAIVLFMKKIFY